MKYILLLFLFACGQKHQPHELQVIASYKDDTFGVGPTYTDGVSGKLIFLHHDKKHNRYDTIIIEVRRQKVDTVSSVIISGNPTAGENKPF